MTTGIDKSEVLKLAKLARIGISDSEAGELSKDFDAILGYVGEVKSAAQGGGEATGELALKNVLREDSHPHESGIYTENILKSAPEKNGEYIKVKKIL